MPAFAIQVPETERVKEYFGKLDEQLRGSSVTAFFFKGGVRREMAGTYIVDVQPLMPRLLVNVLSLLFSAGGFFSWYVGHSGIACVLVGLAILFAGAWNAMYARMTYVLTISVQVSRMVGRLVWAKDVSESILRRRVHGAV